MKRKSLTLTICILTILSLASIGFASWIIINPTPIEPTVGEIAVDDVTSEVFTIETAWDTTSNGKINYGKPVGYVDEDGNPLLDEEGNQKKRTVERIKGFKPAFVFDITQTTGKELQAFKFDENSTVEEKDLIMKGLLDVVGKKGYTFRYATEEELGKGCEGLCNYNTKEILVKEGMSDLQTVSVLVHECGHALAHGPYRESFEGIKELPSRDIREVEAESIACVVCSHLGLNTDNYNFSYISGWAQGDISKFRKNMDRIGMFSGDLIEGIDNAFTQDRVAKYQKEKEQSSNEVVTEVPPSSGKKRGRPKKQIEAEAC